MTYRILVALLCSFVARAGAVQLHSASDAALRGAPKKADGGKEGAAPKKGAKIEDLNKDMPLKAQEQGFAGKKVKHEDGKTGSADWQNEYGNSASFAQADPKKAAAKGKDGKAKIEDLNKDMPLKAQEQGFAGKKVKHEDGKTGTADWHSEYGNSPSFAQADPKKKEASAAPKPDKAGAKIEDLNKNMPMKAQEQGFAGKKVQHADGKTGVSDWQNEYGNSEKKASPAPRDLAPLLRPPAR